jgi:hypothetical protein
MGIDVPLQLTIDGTHVSGECISGIAVAEKSFLVPDYPMDSQHVTTFTF